MHSFFFFFFYILYEHISSSSSNFTRLLSTTKKPISSSRSAVTRSASVCVSPQLQLLQCSLTPHPVNTWFERISIMVILLNCVTLGMYQPCENIDCTSDRCQILQVSSTLPLSVCVGVCVCARVFAKCKNKMSAHWWGEKTKRWIIGHKTQSSSRSSTLLVTVAEVVMQLQDFPHGSLVFPARPVSLFWYKSLLWVCHFVMTKPCWREASAVTAVVQVTAAQTVSSSSNSGPEFGFWCW